LFDWGFLKSDEKQASMQLEFMIIYHTNIGNTSNQYPVSNYLVNSNDLNTIYPITQFRSKYYTNILNIEITGEISIDNYNTSNYAVFSSFDLTTDPSSFIVSLLPQIMITNKTTTSFTYTTAMVSASTDPIPATIYFTIIYNSNY